MDKIFDELRRLPCHYCKFYHGYHSKCLKRSQDVDLDVCDDMSLDMEILSTSIERYFEYLDLLHRKT